MHKPLIGMTTYPGEDKFGHQINYQMDVYIQAIQKSGGLPVLIPLNLREDELDSLITRVDGVLLPGGGDIAIEIYKGTFHERVYNVDPQRDQVEISLLKHAIHVGKPFFGICRGIQVINVALGGTLYSHLPDQFSDQIPHPQPGKLNRGRRVHRVRIEPDTRLAEILGCNSLMVNSIHHQGIKDLAAGLLASAFADDGLVEAVELPGHPFGVGVQWHPEWLIEDQDALSLFTAFVKAANS